MTIRDILKILSIVPDNYEIWVWAQKYGRHGGQLIFDAHFKPVVEYTAHDYRDYLMPTRRIDEVAVYAMRPGFDEVLEYR